MFSEARGPGRGRLRPVVRDGRRVWQADWTDSSGQRHRRILGPNRRTAERALAKIIRDRDLSRLGLSTEAGLDMPIGDVVSQYLADLEARARPRTAHDARVMLGRAVSGMGLRFARDVTKPAVAAWRAGRVGRGGVSHKTANTEVGVLHAALEHAVALGQLAANPLTGLKALPVTAQFRRRMPRALTETEIASLLFHAERIDRERVAAAGRQQSTPDRQLTDNRGQPRTSTDTRPIPQAPLLRLLLLTGARWGELVSTRWADVDWERRNLRLRAETTKTQTGRVIPLAEEAVDALAVLQQAATRVLGREPTREAGVFLAPGGRTWRPVDVNRYRDFLHVAMKAAGIAKRDGSGRVVHVHALRHTFATRLARAGVPVQTAAVLTGHRTIDLLVKVYTHLEAEDARSAIGGLPPLPSSGIPAPT